MSHAMPPLLSMLLAWSSWVFLKSCSTLNYSSLVTGAKNTESSAPREILHSGGPIECPNRRFLFTVNAGKKAQADLLNPLSRAWPTRDFKVHDFLKRPINYFNPLWTTEVWNMLVKNTNTYGLWIKARHKGNKHKKSRWREVADLYEMCIFTASLIYIRLGCFFQRWKLLI